MTFAGIGPNYAESRNNSNEEVQGNTNGIGKGAQTENTKSS